MSRKDREQRKREEKRLARKREQTRFIRSLDALAKLGSRPECLDWPITTCRVPVRECWEATGIGCAAIERRQPDGRAAFATFQLGLTYDGVEVFGAGFDRRVGESDEIFSTLGDEIPPSMPGSIEDLARYAWGAFAWSIQRGSEWDRRLTDDALTLIPKPPGKPADWVDAFVGKHGLISPQLLEVVRRGPRGQDLPDGKESVVLTDAIFAAYAPDDLLHRLRTGGSPFEYVGENNGASEFRLMRKVKRPGEWLPRKKEVGTLTIYRAPQPRVVASGMVLSATARLIGALKRVAGDTVSLAETDWRDLEELERRGEAVPGGGDFIPRPQ